MSASIPVRNSKGYIEFHCESCGGLFSFHSLTLLEERMHSGPFKTACGYCMTSVTILRDPHNQPGVRLHFEALPEPETLEDEEGEEEDGVLA